MTVMKLEKGKYLVRKGEPIKAVYIILKGSMELRTYYNSIILESGSVIGLMAAVSGTFEGDYIVNEECMLAAYSFETPLDYKAIFAEQPQYGFAFLQAAMAEVRMMKQRYERLNDKVSEISAFVTKEISEYESWCLSLDFDTIQAEHMAELEQVTLPEVTSEWEMEYVEEMISCPKKLLTLFYGEKPSLCIGEILRLGENSRNMLINMDALKEYLLRAKEYLLCEGEDLLEIWYDLSMKLAQKGEDLSKVQEKVKQLQDFIAKTGFFTKEEIQRRFGFYQRMDFKQYAKVLEEKEDAQAVVNEMTVEEVLNTDFTAYIMNYAGFTKDEILNTKKLLKAYDVAAQTMDTSDGAQRVRKELTKLFYDIYEKAFMRSLREKKVDSVLELFFQFGILDTELAGKEHVAELVPVLKQLENQIAKQTKKGEQDVRVYTFYQWLCMIYRGEREPSRNDFDVDYAGDLLEQRKQHRITREQETVLKHDQDKKIQFEIANMFRTANRATSGHISSFCPVFHEKECIREAAKMLITAEATQKAIDEIRKVDYSCFYREVFFADPEYGIERTEIMKEVLPEIILMPNIGSRAMMWQETAGAKRDTQARFIFPIMTTADVSQLMLEVVGRYRWEICRRIEGVRWNDIRKKSLTSEFYDYVQFYRKNRELTQNAKEKIKADLVHAKNNYREVFVMDYISWMKYEALGNFRLNKVSRKIIAEYIPFTKEVRMKLSDNPMFRDLFSQSEILRKRKKDKETRLFDRYREAGGTMTPELETHLAFFEK